VVEESEYISLRLDARAGDQGKARRPAGSVAEGGPSANYA